jgi:hypothetical protein
MRAVPGIDPDQVKDHVEHYDLYLLLIDQKKQLL